MARDELNKESPNLVKTEYLIRKLNSMYLLKYIYNTLVYKIF